MDSYTATGLAEGFIDGTEEERIEAWQYLENTGLAYQLQGFFGRQCHALIEAGVISPRSAQQAAPTALTKNQFAAICGEYLIDPGVALENENVVAAVKLGDVAKLHTVLKTEF